MQATAVLAPSTPRFVALSRLGDESLARRAAAGNEAAFTALYERYYGPLLAYCRSILLDAEDARDATQSALENALRALPRREPGRPLRPWLYRIAHNESINIVRRRQPVAVSDVEAATLLTVPGPEADAEQRTRLAQLVDDLRMLPERQRGALVMRELSGLSYDEIGGALGVSNEAARRAVFDARTALHDAVDGRATECTSVRRTLSDGDRRHLRARGVRAHLRSCDDCATFERTIGARQADLHALGPWLGGSAALGLIGLGAGGAGAGTLVATGGSVGGGLSWAGLPVAVKGLAVAAVVATTGTAAVEIPKVATPDSRAPQRQAAASRAAVAPAALSPANEALRERALAQAEAARRAARRVRLARAADTARVQPHSSGAAGATAGHAAPAPAPAAATPAPVTAQPTPAAPSRPRQPTPAAAKTPQQLAVDNLERIRQQILAALQSAQTVANSGVQGALQTATAIVTNTLNSVRPLIDRILATVGLSLPTTTSTAPSTTSTSSPVTNILAPVTTLLSGVNSLLQNLFGTR